MKKGQTTIFIILTIIILITISIIFILKKSSNNSIPPEIQPLQSSIQSCIDETSKQAIIHTSERGGYYNLPENFFDETTPYYLYDNQNLMPTKEKIQQQISLYIKDHLPKCTFIVTEFSDFQITSEEPKVTTQIKPNQVQIDILYSILITKDSQTYQLENFNTNIPSRLNTIYNTIEQLMHEQIKDTSSINQHYIYQLSNENNLQTQMFGFLNDSVIFIINDKQNQNFTFIFANKYTPYVE